MRLIVLVVTMQADWLYYFAYGSNLSLARLRQRVPTARRVGTYYLPGHELRFHKQGDDGSAKCDAFASCPEARVHGAVYALDPVAKPYLDQVEGLGWGYAEKWVTLWDDSGTCVEALTYYATRIDSRLQPYTWYVNHVLIGARESALPAHYISELEKIRGIEDADRERDRLQRAIHEIR